MADTEVTTERWLPARGWEGLYEVSDAGRVRSVPRTVAKRGCKGQPVRGRVLAQHETLRGYRQVVFSAAGRTRSQAVHRLVVEAFIGPIPEDREVGHTDNDPRNNTVANLGVITHAENMAHCLRSGRTARGTALATARKAPVLRGDAHPECLFSDLAVEEIRRTFATSGISQRKFAKRIGMSHQHLSDILSRRKRR